MFSCLDLQAHMPQYPARALAVAKAHIIETDRAFNQGVASAYSGMDPLRFSFSTRTLSANRSTCHRTIRVAIKLSIKHCIRDENSSL